MNFFSRGILVTLDKPHRKTLRCTLRISESLIYCSRRGTQNSVIPTFHFGLCLQLHHVFGRRSLIVTLHSYGFCCSNDNEKRNHRLGTIWACFKKYWWKIHARR